MTHLLVTNDFPPKIGGIQNYLWELWRRLPADSFVVYTTPHDEAAAFDAGQRYRVVRADQGWLLPTPSQTRRIDALAAEIGATSVLFDPAMPIGVCGPSLSVPYGVVLHGAEVTVPARLPVLGRTLARTVEEASFVVSASGYAHREAERLVGHRVEATYVPPGVDVGRFVPLDSAARAAARRSLGVGEDAEVVVSVSRLVRRKGMDVLIEAAARLARTRPRLEVVIAGRGRDEGRLRRLAARVDAPVRFLGRVADADLPTVYGMADLFVMLCHSRWGGMEEEGFGIVFLEAAAAGIAQVAGRSGGAAEAVADGETGIIVDEPRDVAAVCAIVADLLDDPGRRAAMAEAARRRAVEEFSYDVLVGRLAAIFD